MFFLMIYNVHFLAPQKVTLSLNNIFCHGKTNYQLEDKTLDPGEAIYLIIKL